MYNDSLSCATTSAKVRAFSLGELLPAPRKLPDTDQVLYKYLLEQ